MKPDVINETDKKRILRERAAMLAVEEVSARAVEEAEVLKFILNREQYGLESKYIREVHPLKNFTQVPCTPSFVAGIVNIRGQILSVIDIGKFFGMESAGLSDLNRVIILNSDEMEFGILADEILGVAMIPVDTIKSSLPALRDVRSEYLKGVTVERLVILDGGKILADEKLVVKEEAGI